MLFTFFDYSSTFIDFLSVFCYNGEQLVGVRIMDNFLERKEKYLNKLRENIDIIEKLAVRTDTEIGKSNYKVLMSPSNERELTISEMMLDSYIEFSSFKDDVKNGRVKEIPFDENVGLQTYISIYNHVKNGEKLNADLYDRNDPETIKMTARVYYEYLSALCEEGDDSINYMMKKCGFKKNDAFSMMKFYFLLDAAQVEIRKIMPEIDYKNYTDRELENCKILDQEFHRLYDEGKIVKKENEMATRVENEVAKLFLKKQR